MTRFNPHGWTGAEKTVTTHMNREQAITEAFVSLTDTVADDVDPLTLLRRLADHCVRLTAMDAAGVMLVNARGRLQSVVVTEDRVELTEMFQVQVSEGPCIDAYVTGEPVHADDLATDGDRWPVFTPLAEAAGFSAAHSFPLQLRSQNIGALNLLARTPTPVPPEDSRLLQALAGTATTSVLTWSREPLRPYDIVTRTQAALSGKAVLDIAAGMLAATAHITPSEGEQKLRAYAAAHDQRPADIADDLVRRRLTPHAVLTPAP
ncbi:GAF and ANTAR domain-containing protein [Streptomyces sp. WAC05950]|uniref:GAF and ANTAR domain-containing protein n=1 Tax=Streptomyces sp. WAC05950 TaxID=2487419 RepID=UPI000F73D1BC|nr:GAF and ANTAR domain-containing protein [Streptomyces sp. WAC05950]RST03719.1 ANTAR domain-containing protein [Streptomyces sp. WAC05950]